MRVAFDAVLLEFVLDKPNGDCSSVNWNINFFEKIRYSAYMILVPVGYDKSDNPLGILLYKRKVRNHNVDSVHIVFRKGHAAVYNQELIIVFEHGHILPDFIESAYRVNL